MKLLDVGVWLATVWGRHAHHPIVAEWFEGEAEEIAFCRVTQMGLLRLVTNPAVMGADAVDRSEVWRIYDQLRADERITWANEPAGLNEVWRAISARRDKSYRLWTDDYLAGFAQVSGATLTTLDRKLRARYPATRVESLLR